MRGLFVFILTLCLLFASSQTLLAGLLFSPTPQSPPPDRNDWQIARRFVAEGNISEALPFFERLYAQDPNPILYRDYLQALLDQQLYKEAENLIRKQQKKERNPLYDVDMGSLYLQLGQHKKADKAFLLAVSSYNKNEGVGVHIEELSKALIKSSLSMQYSIKLYNSERAKEGIPYAYSYQLFQCYLQSREIDKMILEAQLFFSSCTNSDLLQQALERIKADLQILISGVTTQASTSNSTSATSTSSSTTSTSSTSSTSNTTISTTESKALKKAIYTAIQKDLFNIGLRELLLWVYLQEKNYDEALQTAVLYVNRFNDQGNKLLETIGIMIENGVYEKSEKALSFLIQKSKDETSGISVNIGNKALMLRLELHYKLLEQRQISDSTEINRLKTEYEQLWELRKDDPNYWPIARNLSRIYAYFTHEEEKAHQVMEKALSWPRIGGLKKAEIKVEYADILLFVGKTWDAMLLYSQVEKDFKQDAIGFYAKLQNARLSYYVGEFEWAISQLDVLKAATAKLIANDAMQLSLMIKENNNPDSTYEGLRYVSRADGFAYRRLYPEALKTLDSVLQMPMEYALYDDVNYKKAEIYLQLDSLSLAIAALERVYRQGGEYESTSIWADDALLLAAQTLEKRSGDKDLLQAMDLYLELFTRFPSSLLAPQAKERYRALRERLKEDNSLNKALTE